MNVPLYFWTQAGFLLLTLVSFTLFLREIWKGIALTEWPPARKKRVKRGVVGALLAWAGFVAAWSLSGTMENFSIFPFNLMPVLLIPLISLGFLLASKGFSQLLRNIPAATMIRLQSFRFFVEVLLWMLFLGEVLPEQMTFEGRNFDILVGISAPIIATLLVTRRITKTGIVIWNFLGLALLLNIVTIAILSTPSPLRVFMNEPANYIVARFPISWLPGLLVPLAYYLHAISLKQMLQGKTMVASKDREQVSVGGGE